MNFDQKTFNEKLTKLEADFNNTLENKKITDQDRMNKETKYFEDRFVLILFGTDELSSKQLEQLKVILDSKKLSKVELNEYINMTKDDILDKIYLDLDFYARKIDVEIDKLIKKRQKISQEQKKNFCRSTCSTYNGYSRYYCCSRITR